MSKVLILWKGVNARVPADPKEAMKLFSFLTQTVQEDLKSGKLKDWGVFAEGSEGYAIYEGNEIDLAMEVGKYTPFIEFEARMVLSVDQQMGLLQKMTQSIPK